MIYENKTRIGYYELDFRGKLKLSALLRMINTAAEEDAKQLGIGFSVLHPLNISFVLQRFGLNVVRMPEYDESITIRTWPAAITRGTFIRKGDMYDQRGTKLMEWASLWILLDLEARKILKPSALPVEIPPLGSQEATTEAERIILPEGSGDLASTYTHTVRYAEVDTNRHMNNSIYGDLIGNALFQSTETELDIKNVQINFLAETRMGEQIEVSANLLEGKYIITGQAPGRMAFTAKVSP